MVNILECKILNLANLVPYERLANFAQEINFMIHLG